jgi:uncharacterized membrane protein YhiD involved in acid resistance
MERLELLIWVAVGVGVAHHQELVATAALALLSFLTLFLLEQLLNFYLPQHG